MRVAVYPGTFDPVTYGHLDIIERALKLFDKVIVTVAINSAKKPIFTTEERLHLLRQATKKYPTVEVDSFDGLLVDYVRSRKAIAVIRGLRAMTDFEYELQMALLNRRLYGNLETVFLMPKEQYTYLSSNFVREIAALGGDVSQFVPPVSRKALEKKFRKHTMQ
ncbi:MAG: pantetheine-phosphate adenylyltransferase [Bacteroidetes bacterium]|nr:pantetheine-phosphate adenylyltransferase [Bacteroidota bacterium]